MFIPYTPNGELAKILRDNENKLEDLTGTRLKIVERTGTKLVDLITRSNPWQGLDCQRENCLLCFTKSQTEKLKSQECTKRNIVYETRCRTCEDNEKLRIEELEIDEKSKLEEIKKLKIFKYIGETSRSAFERGWEYVNDMATLNKRSHMLKHVIMNHPEDDMADVKFGMKVLKFCQTSFERQVLEAVTIQKERKTHHLLNSRTEYNRSSLPRLSTQMGEQAYKEYNKELEDEKKSEDYVEMKIRELRKQRNKARLHPTKELKPTKRRKINENNQYITIEEIWGKPPIAAPGKNKPETENGREKPNKKQKIQIITKEILIEDENNRNNTENKQLEAKSRKVDQYKKPETKKPEEGTQNKIQVGDPPSQQSRPKPPPTPPPLPVQNSKPTLYKPDAIPNEEKLENETELNKVNHPEPSTEIQKQEEEKLSWELLDLCREYLEENSADWKKRKEKRIEEKERQERLEKTRILSKQAKIRYIEKKIEIGMTKIPETEKKLIEDRVRKEKKLKLKEIKEDLWKLKGRKKKYEKPSEAAKIAELQKRSQEIVDILKKEKEKIEKEKKKDEFDTTMNKNKIKDKIKKIEKEEKLKEKWDICEWVADYIEKNLEDWEKDDSDLHEQIEKKEHPTITKTTTTVWKKIEKPETEKKIEKYIENTKIPPPENKTPIKLVEKTVEEVKKEEHQSKLTNFKFTTSKNNEKTNNKETTKTSTNTKKTQINNVPKSIKTKPSPAKAKTDKKRKELEKKKTIKQLQGFWTDFAKRNQELKSARSKKNENSAPACQDSSPESQQMAVSTRQLPAIADRHVGENSSD